MSSFSNASYSINTKKLFDRGILMKLFKKFKSPQPHEVVVFERRRINALNDFTWRFFALRRSRWMYLMIFLFRFCFLSNAQESNQEIINTSSDPSETIPLANWTSYSTCNMTYDYFGVISGGNTYHYFISYVSTSDSRIHVLFSTDGSNWLH